MRYPQEQKDPKVRQQRHLAALEDTGVGVLLYPHHREPRSEIRRESVGAPLLMKDQYSLLSCAPDTPEYAPSEALQHSQLSAHSGPAEILSKKIRRHTMFCRSVFREPFRFGKDE